MILKNYILKAISFVKKNNEDNVKKNNESDYEKNFIKFSEKKDKFSNEDLFFCKYVENSNLLIKDKVNILDLGCSEGADEVFTKFNFFSYAGCDSLEKEIIKLKTENTNNNLSYYNFTIIPPENKKEFNKKYKFKYFKNDMDYFTFKKTLAFEHIEKYEKKKENRKRVYDQLDRANNNDNNKFTVDQIIKEKLKKNFNLIKIDIDGYTNDALYGASEILNTNSLFLLKIEVNYTDPMADDHFVEAYNYLYSKSFKLYRMSQRQYLHIGYYDKFVYDFPGQNFFGTDQQGDLVFIQDFEKVYSNFRNGKITLNEIYKYFVLLEILNFNDLAIFILNKYSDVFNANLIENIKNLFIKKLSKIHFDKELSYQEIKNRYNKI